MRATAPAATCWRPPRERGYLACESCGAIVTLEGAALEAVRGSVRAASGFEPDLSHFPVVGRCARCA